MAMKVRRGNETRTGTNVRRSQEAASESNAHSLLQEELRRMIAEKAYLRAAHRGFAPGGELDDWLAAEREVRIASGAARK